MPPPVVISGADVEHLVQKRLAEDPVHATPHPFLSFLEPFVSLRGLHPDEERFLSWFFLWRDQAIALYVHQPGGHYAIHYLKRPGIDHHRTTVAAGVFLVVHDGKLHVGHDARHTEARNVHPDSVLLMRSRHTGIAMEVVNALQDMGAHRTTELRDWLPLTDTDITQIGNGADQPIGHRIAGFVQIAKRFQLHTPESIWLNYRAHVEVKYCEMDASLLPTTDGGAFLTDKGIIIPTKITCGRNVAFYRHRSLKSGPEPLWMVCVFYVPTVDEMRLDEEDRETVLHPKRSHLRNIAKNYELGTCAVEYGQVSFFSDISPLFFLGWHCESVTCG